MSTLQELIEQRVNLGREAATGFQACVCPLCNDYKERAGWKFEPAKITYHCFNCSTTSFYDTNEGHFSKKLKEILKGFGINDDEIARIKGTSFFRRVDTSSDVITLDDVQKVSLATPEVSLPDSTIPLSKLGNDNEYARYLLARGIDLFKYQFYICAQEKYNNRIIIPSFRRGKIIYWQARTITDDKPRYLNCVVSREAVMFNFDELYQSSDKVLFITEGVFDAMHVDGIALLGSKLSDAKIEYLQKTRRRKVFVIDQDANGKKLAEKVLELQLGDITFAPDGHDIDSSIREMGKIWTVHYLLQNAVNKLPAARIKLNMLCK